MSPHAEAGELCERFGTLHLIEGDEVTATVPTYRGEGQEVPVTAGRRHGQVLMPLPPPSRRSMPSVIHCMSVTDGPLLVSSKPKPSSR